MYGSEDSELASDSRVVPVVADDGSLVTALEAALARRGESASVRHVGAPGAVSGASLPASGCVLVSADGVDALAAVERVREERPSVSVVLLTADAAGDVAFRASEAGATTVLPRPATDAAFEAVTERVVSELARRHAERTYREVFEKSSDGIFVHDPETGDVLEANPRACEMSGYSREELTDRSVGDFSASDEGFDQAAALERIRAASTEGPQTFEWKNVRPDGTSYWSEISLVRTEIGGRDRVIANARDITERKEHERKRRQREQTYREVFDKTAATMTLHDPETGEMLDANETLCDLLGYERSALLERGLTDITADVDGYDPDDAVDALVRVAESGDSLTGEWPLETANGETRWVETTLTTADIMGETRVLSTAREITDLKHRERELREVESTYQEIFHTVNDLIAVLDPETGEIVDVNDTYAEVLGYDRETILELNVDGISAGEEYTLDRSREIIQQVMETGDPVEGFDWRVETADGDRRWVEVNATPATLDGERRVLGIARDVTERRAREQELREAERRFRLLTENVDEVIFNTRGIVTMPEEAYDDPPEDAGMDYISPAFEDVWGRPVESAYEDPRVLYEGVHPEDREAFAAVVDEMAADAETGDFRDSYDLEFRVQQPDGEVRWVVSSAYPVPIEGSDVYYWVGIMTDVTEERRRERTLQEFAERVDETFYVSSPDLQEVHYMSPSYEETWGRPVEEVYEEPESFMEYIHPEDIGPFREQVDRMRTELTDPTVEEQDSYDFDYRVVRPDGEVRWVDVTGYPLRDDHGTVYRFIALLRDVTETRRREQTLDSLHDATRQLTTADTRQAACRTAVDAAANVLGFPLVAVSLYDEESGTLEPVAATDAFEALPVEPPRVTPDSGVLWQAYVEGDPVWGLDRGAVFDRETAASPELLIPLGTHGVMLVCAREGEVDAEDRELAHVLAATLEAGLNHVRGARRVEAHKRELEARTERVERLDRLNTLVRDIEQAMVERSTRQELEQAICDRLGEVESYALAWIGTASAAATEIVPSTSSLAGSGYVEQRRVDLHGDDPDHPAAIAYESGRVETVDNLVGTDGGDWRTQALTHGYLSCCAVPLVYDEVTHGVLVILSESPQAFDEREQTVLEELGRSIGSAITSLERKRALESDVTTELEFDVSDSALFVVRVAGALEDSAVELDRTIRREDGTISAYYAVEGATADAAVETLSAQPDVVDVRVVSDRDTGCVLEVTRARWFGSTFAKHGGVVREARSDGTDGRVLVEVPTEADVRTLVETFRGEHPGVELTAKRERTRASRSVQELQHTLEERLTDRQQEALETAFTAGYFEWPRDSGGQEIAAMLDITQPTFNKHLRLAERKTFSLLLD
jgi:PAS domain S-box-containing protein